MIDSQRSTHSCIVFFSFLVRFNVMAYRSFVGKLQAPVIPFMPLLLKDMTFAHEGNKTSLEGLVNFEKMHMMAQTMRTLRFCRSRHLGKFNSSYYLRSVQVAPRSIWLIGQWNNDKGSTARKDKNNWNKYKLKQHGTVTYSGWKLSDRVDSFPLIENHNRFHLYNSRYSARSTDTQMWCRSTWLHFQLSCHRKPKKFTNNVTEARTGTKTMNWLNHCWNEDPFRFRERIVCVCAVKNGYFRNSGTMPIAHCIYIYIANSFANPTNTHTHTQTVTRKMRKYKALYYPVLFRWAAYSYSWIY